MIRKLRLRFILAALVSILFVLASTIAAINVSNYLKISGETAQTLYDVIEYSHQNVLFANGVFPTDENGEAAQPGPGGFFDPRRGDINEQFFATVFDADGVVTWSDYDHIAQGDIDNESREAMATEILAR